MILILKSFFIGFLSVTIPDLKELNEYYFKIEEMLTLKEYEDPSLTFDIRDLPLLSAKIHQEKCVK